MEFAIIALTVMCSLGFHFASEYLLLTFRDEDWNDIWPRLTKWQKIALKPIVACPPCMGSIHGTFWHFYLGGEFYLWPVTCLSVVFLNHIAVKLLK